MPHFIVIITIHQPNTKLKQYDLSTSTKLPKPDKASGVRALSAAPLHWKTRPISQSQF